MIDVLQYLSALGPLQIIGLLGFLIYVFAFGLVQIDRMDGNSVQYTICNVLAASLVAVSLYDEFNLSSALIQGSWIVIGLVGLVKRQFHRRASTSRSTTPYPSQELV